MSILLEGKLQVNDTPSPTFTGIWQFSKERKTNLKFTYQYKSNEIPGDLLDYVSFANEPLAANPSPLIPNRNIRGRGRGRLKHSSTQPSSAPESAENPVDKQDFVDLSSKDQESEISNEIANEDNSTKDISSASLPEKHSEPVRIPQDHPLFGLWEGSFEVKSGSCKCLIVYHCLHR